MRNALVAVFLIFPVFAKSRTLQQDTGRLHHIAVFAPLYLDSAFDATNTYRLGKSLPRYIASGLDFYRGVTMALDSLAAEGVALDVTVYDTRSTSGSISEFGRWQTPDQFDLIIGAVNGNEYLQLAGLAKERNIPFISATYPNDGGVTSNPQVVVVNSKLNTHLTSLYNYLLRNFGTTQLVLFRRRNAQDDRVSEVLKQLNGSTNGVILNIKTVVLEDNFRSDALTLHLDSVRQNTVICGSLDENFGYTLALQTASIASSYPVTLIGMPTWDNQPLLLRPEVRNISIIYSSTFFNNGTDPWAARFSKNFARLSYSKPGDMAFRGFELTYFFSRLLDRYDTTLIAHLNDRSHRLLTDFDFRPVYWSKNATKPDYYENKRIYIVRRLNGLTTKLN